MNLLDLLSSYGVKRPLVIGFYGGTNYGDELLLEVLQNLLIKEQIPAAVLYYSKPDIYAKFHHNFGNKLVSTKGGLLMAIFKSKSIIIGGGGIWGVDANANILILSAILFLAGTVLRKKIFLVSIGYYDSTNFYGHAGALLIGSAATAILARDGETLRNFKKFNKNTYLDKDLSWYIPEIPLDSYSDEVSNIAESLHLKENRVLIGLRRFASKLQNDYTKLIVQLVQTNPLVKFTVGAFESCDVAPEEFQLVKDLESRMPNCIGFDFSYNPLAFYLALSQNRTNLSIIAPQYHVQISAFANGIPFLPIDYDSKNREFFKDKAVLNAVSIDKINLKELEAFISTK